MYKSKTILFAPFEIIDDLGNEEIARTFMSRLTDLKPVTHPSLLDISKYYDFVAEYIGDDPNNFLRCFMLDINQLSDKEGVKYAQAFNKTSFYLDDHQHLQLTVSRILIIINEIANIGYLAFVLDFRSSADHPLSLMQRTDVLRYFANAHATDKKPDKKYSIRVRSADPFSSKEYPGITFFEIYEKYLHILNGKIRFLYAKPIVLHCYSSPPSDNLGTIASYCFNAVRVPPQSKSAISGHDLDQFIDKDDLQIINGNIYIFTMNEGVVVIDGTVGIEEMISKYTASFLVAMNQRELLLNMNRVIARMHYNEIFKTSAENLHTFRLLAKRLTLCKLKQIFYSVSSYHEIACFFRTLQGKFNIEILLKDNQESIEEMAHLIQSEKDLRDEKSKKMLNILIGFLSLSGFVSATMDFFNFPLKEIPLTTFIILALLIVVLIRRSG